LKANSWPNTICVCCQTCLRTVFFLIIFPWSAAAGQSCLDFPLALLSSIDPASETAPFFSACRNKQTAARPPLHSRAHSTGDWTGLLAEPPPSAAPPPSSPSRRPTMQCSRSLTRVAVASRLMRPAAAVVQRSHAVQQMMLLPAAVHARSFAAGSAPRFAAQSGAAAATESAAGGEAAAAAASADESLPKQSRTFRLPEWADAPNPQLLSLDNLQPRPMKRVRTADTRTGSGVRLSAASHSVLRRSPLSFSPFLSVCVHLGSSLWSRSRERSGQDVRSRNQGSGPAQGTAQARLRGRLHALLATHAQDRNQHAQPILQDAHAAHRR